MATELFFGCVSSIMGCSIREMFENFSRSNKIIFKLLHIFIVQQQFSRGKRKILKIEDNDHTMFFFFFFVCERLETNVVWCKF